MAKELAGLDRDKLKQYWAANVKLTSIVLAIWFIVSFVAIFFSSALNQIVIAGFPMGYYMGAQGSLIVFVIIIFVYAFKMNANDKKYGVEEEE